MKEINIKENFLVKDAQGKEYVIKSVDGTTKIFENTKNLVRVLKSFRSDVVAEQWLANKKRAYPEAKVIKSFAGYELSSPVSELGMSSHVVIEETPLTQVIQAVSGKEVDELFSELFAKGFMEVSDYGGIGFTEKFEKLKNDFVERAITKKSFTGMSVEEKVGLTLGVFKAMSEEEASNDKLGGPTNTAVSEDEAMGLLDAAAVVAEEGSDSDPAPKQAGSQSDADNATLKAINATGGVAQTLEKQDLMKGVDAGPCWDGYKQVGTKRKEGKTVPNCVPASEIEKGFTIFKSMNDAQIYNRVSQGGKDRVRALSVREKSKFGPFNFVVEQKNKKNK